MHLTDEKIYECIDGELGLDENAVVLRHIGQCEQCSERFSRLKSIESSLNSFLPDDAQIEAARAQTKARIGEVTGNGGTFAFFKRTFTVSFGGFFTTAAAFVMIMIGAIVALKPNGRQIEMIVPAANSNASLDNIHKVSDESVRTLEDHIRAIEDMGYNVVLEPI